MWGSAHSVHSSHINSIHSLAHEGAENEVKTETDADFIEADDNVDGGWAWMVLFSSCLSIAIVCGICYTTGVYNVVFLDAFQESTGLTSWVGGLLSASSCIGAIFASFLLNRFDARFTWILAGVISSGAFILSSFARNIPYLVVTYGLLTGLSLALVYAAANVSVGMYFHKRRSMALGIAQAGGGIGIFIYPVLIETLLEEYAWRGSFYIQSGICLNLCVLGALLRPLPKQKTQSDSPPIFDIEILKDCKFLIVLLSAFFWHTGLGISCVHLAACAVNNGATKLEASALYSVYGVGSVMGKLLGGGIANDPDVGPLLIYLSTLGITGLLMFLSPFFFTSYYSHVLYALTNGIYGCAPIVLITPIMVNVMGVDRLPSTYGIMNTIAGIGFLVGPVAAGYLYDLTKSYFTSFYLGGACYLSGAVTICFILRRPGRRPTEMHIRNLTSVVDNK